MGGMREGRAGTRRASGARNVSAPRRNASSAAVTETNAHSKTCQCREASRILRAVILLSHALAQLPAPERFALELLTDLARLVPVDDPAAGVVRLEVADGPAAGDDPAALVARRWDVTSADGVVRISHAALRTVAATATAERERRSEVRDRFERVPSSENALAAAGLDRTPVVSHAAAALRSAVASAAGARPLRLVAPWPHGRRWAAAFTHDLDLVALWPLSTGLRLAELVRKGDRARAAIVARAAFAGVAGDPVRRGVDAMLDAERGIAATWFVLCGTPTPVTVCRGDLTYRPESAAARAIIAAVADAGHEVALHGSFETLDRDNAFAEQRARLTRITGRAVSGVRQHFLRMRPGRTERAMHAAGFRYDSTTGFADRNGFRTGIADVCPVWDPALEQASGFVEIPFCFMDRALSKYRGEEDPAAWQQEAVALAAACRDVEGLWVGIWHPNVTLAELGFPGAATAFASMVDAIVADHPYVATLDTIARWRAARRSVRVRSVKADGTADAYLAAPGAWDEPLALEDAARRPRELAR